MDKRELLSNRLKELCEEKNMTYQILSEVTCLPIKRVYRLYSGLIENPSVFLMMDICDGLGITLDEFFDTEEFRKLYE